MDDRTPPPPPEAGLFADPPARDARFVVKERWIDCARFAPGDPRREVEFLHRQMNEEVNGLEASAKTLTDFPEADWEWRMGLARQCSDEARHAVMFRRLYESKGGRVGEYPVLNFQYRIISAVPTLVGRLMVQNRSFEAGGIDAIDVGIDVSRRDGQLDMVDLFEAQLADEIQHVRFANGVIAALKKREPRTILLLGTALGHAAKGFRYVMGKEATEGVRFPVAEGARAEAGFSAEEIRLASGLSEQLGTAVGPDRHRGSPPVGTAGGG